MRLFLFAALLVAQLFSAQVETGAITGTVILPGGSPAVGVRVVAMPAREAGIPGAGEVFSALTETDARGLYRLEKIEPGDYYIRAGFVNSPTYYPGVTALSNAKTVAVRPAATVVGMDFVILGPTGVKVSGRVILDPRQKPLSVEPRVLLARGARDVTEILPAADGSFEFVKVPPDTYSVVLRGAAAIRGIVVGNTDVTGIELRAPLRVEVKGRVVGPNESSAPGGLGLSFNTPVRTAASPPGQVSAAFAPVRAQFSQDGSFRVVLLETTYSVFFDSVPEGFFVQSAVYGSTDLLKDSLPIPPKDPGELVVTLGRSSERR